MLWSDLIRRSWRSLRSASTRTWLTAFAIAVGTFALTLTLAASNGATAYVNRIIADNFDPTELIVTNDKTLFGRTDSSKPKEYDTSISSVTNQAGATTQVKMLTDSDLDRLREVPGVEGVRTASTVSLQYITRPGLRKYAATMQAYNAVSKPELLAGAVPATIPDKSVVLPEGFLADMDFATPQDAIGKTVTVSVQKQAGTAALQSLLAQYSAGGAGAVTGAPANPTLQEDFTIIAVTKKPVFVQPGTDLYLFAAKKDVTALSDFATAGSANYHKYISAYVKVADGANKSKLVAVQDKLKDLGYGAQSVEDTQKFLTQIITVLQGIVAAFGFIAIVASVFGIINTMYITVMQRTREIGLMKALGMPKRDITRLFRLEAALIGLLGGLLGSVSAVVLGTLANPWIATQLGLGTAHLLIFHAVQIVGLVVILMIVATLAGLLPARKAARLNPIEALRTE